MNPILLVDPKGGGIRARLTRGRALALGAVLDLTRQQRTTVMRQRQTMSPVTKSKAKSLQTSKLVADAHADAWS